MLNVYVMQHLTFRNTS